VSTVMGLIDPCLQPEQIRENVKALDLYPKLTPEVMDKINGILTNTPAVQVNDALASLR